MAPRTDLEESIRHLREELADPAPLSAEDRVLLDRTLENVARFLEEEDEEENSIGESLVEPIYEELRELSVRIESSHPSLSRVLTRIVDSMSQIGI